MNIPRHAFAIPAIRSLLLAATLLATACSTVPPAQSTQDPQANFAAFSTFAWDKGHESQPSTEPLTILDNNIRTAIAGDLQRKGYSEAAQGTTPSLLLRYETGAAEKIKSNPFRIGFGVGSYGSSGGASVGVSTPGARNVNEGTLILRAIDPARNAEVWNGRVSRELGSGGTPDQALIRGAVSELLEKFPKRASSPQ